MLLGAAQIAVKAALHAIPINQTLGVTITEVGTGAAAGTLAVRPDLANPALTLHAADRTAENALPGHLARRRQGRGAGRT